METITLQQEEYLNKILDFMYGDKLNGVICPRAEAKRFLFPLFAGIKKGINWEAYVELCQKMHEDVEKERYLMRDLLNLFLKALEDQREITFDHSKGRYWVCCYEERKFFPCLFLWLPGNTVGQPAFFRRKISAERYFRAVISF